MFSSGRERSAPEPDPALCLSSFGPWPCPMRLDSSSPAELPAKGKQKWPSQSKRKTHEKVVGADASSKHMCCPSCLFPARKKKPFQNWHNLLGSVVMDHTHTTVSASVEADKPPCWTDKLKTNNTILSVCSQSKMFHLQVHWLCAHIANWLFHSKSVTYCVPQLNAYKQMKISQSERYFTVHADTPFKIWWWWWWRRYVCKSIGAHGTLQTLY